MFHENHLVEFTIDQKQKLFQKFWFFLIWVLIGISVTAFANWFHEVDYRWTILKSAFIPIIATAWVGVHILSPLASEKGLFLKFIRNAFAALVWAGGLAMIPYGSNISIGGDLSKFLLNFTLFISIISVFGHLKSVNSTLLDRKFGWPENK